MYDDVICCVYVYARHVSTAGGESSSLGSAAVAAAVMRGEEALSDRW